jgi:two-component system phosphate regulon sensor histidine kinase PhoR
MTLGRVWMTLAVLSWLALAGVATLAAFGVVGLWPVLGTMACVLLAQALLLQGFLTGLPRLRRATEAMLDSPESPMPRFQDSGPGLEEVSRMLGRASKQWRGRIEALEAELDRSRQVVTTLPDPLLLLNQRREVVEGNAAARALFGDKMQGRDLAVALRNPDVLDAADAVLRDGVDRVIEFDMAAPVERQLSARLTPLRLGEGVPSGALLVLHDLTAVKRTEQMRVDFVANASHELRTPLSALLGFIETLRGPAADDTEAQKRFLGIMHQQATRMIRLVEDLLSLSRIELNEHMTPTDRIALEPLLRHLAQTLELKAKDRGMIIDLALPADCPAVTGDADELTQVFQNLLDNAVKYGRPQTHVTVSVKPSGRLGQGLAIAVRDQGEGIARIHLPRLTERFYRVDSARSRQMGGTGLGLAIVKHIVSRHRGHLEIDSTLGEGSVFTVHLPMAAAKPGNRPPTSSDTGTSTKKRSERNTVQGGR